MVIWIHRFVERRRRRAIEDTLERQNFIIQKMYGIINEHPHEDNNMHMVAHWRHDGWIASYQYVPNMGLRAQYRFWWFDSDGRLIATNGEFGRHGRDNDKHANEIKAMLEQWNQPFPN